MNRFLAGIFVVTLVLAGGYWYRHVESKCDTPLLYSVGDIDARFDISKSEVRAALSDAESLWEDATGENLFTYDEDADFKVHFVYDDRQETTKQEGEIRTELDTKEEVSQQIKDEYERLVREYRQAKEAYEERVADYEQALAMHNEEVESWNTKGGAPEEVFARLNGRTEDLADEHRSLNTTARKLNELVASINGLGDKGNRVVEDYNEDVAWYNSLFAEEREFTQGEYRGDRIHIYQYDDGTELRRVLAHELGHAISLGHVDDEHAVMHYLMEGKLGELELSLDDVAEFRRVCGAR